MSLVKKVKYTPIQYKKYFKQFKNKHPRGYTLLFTVIISGIITVVGFGVLNIIEKELLLSGNAADSQAAFYAADTGMECALFWDKNHPGFDSSVFVKDSKWNVVTTVLPGAFESLGNVTGNENDNSHYIFFKPTGDRMFVADRDDQRVYQYNVPVPWDVTSIVQPPLPAFKHLNGSGVNDAENIRGIFFKPTGDRMFVVDLDDKGVYQYTLSAPWNITSVVLPGVFKGLDTVLGNNNNKPYGIFFKPTGDRMFILDLKPDVNNSRVYQYNVPVPWDVTSIVQPPLPVSKELGSFGGNNNDNPYSIFFKPEGDRMFLSDIEDERVYQYNIPVPWDVTSIVQPPLPAFKALDILNVDDLENPRGIFFKPTGDRIFVSDNVDEGVYQYTIETEFSPVPQSTDNVLCNEANITDSPEWEDINGDNNIVVVPFEMHFDDDGDGEKDDSCVFVTMEKNAALNQTRVESRGYNTCDTDDPRRVERAIRARY